MKEDLIITIEDVHTEQDFQPITLLESLAIYAMMNSSDEPKVELEDGLLDWSGKAL